MRKTFSIVIENLTINELETLASLFHRLCDACDAAFVESLEGQTADASSLDDEALSEALRRELAEEEAEAYQRRRKQKGAGLSGHRGKPKA